jgi:large subunit ribosomal protein L30
MSRLKITWTRSGIGRPQSQRRTIRSLGLRRLHHSVIHGDTPSIRGMVNKVQHLVAVEALEDDKPKPSRRRTTAESKT